MTDLRKKNWNWNIHATTYEAAQLAVLMDIRDELQRLNHVFNCYKFLQIPNRIEAIRKNTAKPRRKRKAK